LRKEAQRKLEKRAVSGIMLTLLLLSILALAFNVQPVGSSGTIYIRADGSVDPPTAPIQRDGDIYTFTDNIYDSIVVQRDNIMVDGVSFTLQGTGAIGSRGFDISYRRNVTIKNTHVTRFYYGTYLQDSSNNVLANNIVTQSDTGIFGGFLTSNNLITNNTITDNYAGIRVSGSYNVLTNNIVTNNNGGISLSTRSGEPAHNMLRNNNMTGNLYNFGARGDLSPSSLINDIDSSNTVDDKPIYYWVNRKNEAVPSDAGYVQLVNCRNITVKGLELENNVWGIILTNTTHSQIANNILKKNRNGIELYHASNNNNISANTVTHIVNYGIKLSRSLNNLLYNNTLTNVGCVLMCDSSSNNLLGNNTITNSEAGFYLLYTSNNVLTNNTITNNSKYGIQLDNSLNNVLSANTVANNSGWYGIRIRYSSGNTLYHNNFVDNIQQVLSDNSPNVWDNGYPSGGNYWSDYTDVDLYSGPYQNETGSDGIWDHPYVIDADNRDSYPFVNPWTPTPPSQADLSVSIDWVSNYSPLEGEPVEIRVIVKNIGSKSSVPGYIQLWQRTYFNQPVSGGWDALLGNFSIPELAPGESKSFDFTWNTVGIKYVDPAKCLELEIKAGDIHRREYVTGLSVDDRSPFEVDVHGFSFTNWEWSLFELEDLKRWIKLKSLPWDFVGKFENLLYPLLAKSGHCYGMAAASIIYYKEPDKRPVPKETFEMLKDEVASEIAQYHVQQGAFALALLKRALVGMNLQDEYEKIVNNLQRGQPIVMGICFRDGRILKKTHAVTVFNVYDVSVDVKNIIVYDNEYPGTAVVFTFDLKNNVVYCPVRDFTGQPLYENIEAVYVDIPGPYSYSKAKKTINDFLLDLAFNFITFKCPVNVTITDELSRIISEVENQIPGASFEHCNLTGTKTFCLPLNLAYNVQVYANNHGNCTVGQIIPLGSVYETGFSQVTFNLTSETVAEFDLLPYDANYTLKVDENGDGSIDYELAPEVETLTTEYDIGITEIVPSKTIIGQGYNLPIHVTIMNYGAHTETFNITLYANMTSIMSQTITLLSGNSTTITFTWNTTGVPYGNYTISVNATTIPGETNTVDNTYTYGTIKITIPGDINGDRVVDSTDQGILGLAWGSVTGEPTYIPEADLNGDGVVDSTDYGILGANWGRTWS